VTNLSSPTSAVTLPIPLDNGVRLDDSEIQFLFGPEAGEEKPESPIRSREFDMRRLSLKDGDLLLPILNLI
jgi:hypothetical protein